MLGLEVGELEISGLRVRRGGVGRYQHPLGLANVCFGARLA